MSEPLSTKDEPADQWDWIIGLGWRRIICSQCKAPTSPAISAMSDALRQQGDNDNEAIWIGGEAVDGEFTITMDNNAEPLYGDDLKPADVITGGSWEFSTTVDLETYAKYVAPTHEASMSMIRGGPRAQEPRCLWGGRRGYVQVGSLRDIFGDYMKIDIPRVRFKVD